MRKRSDIVRYSDKELKDMQRRGENRTNWAKVDATTEADLEASIAADPDDLVDVDWTRAVIGLPPRKLDIHIRIDSDVLAWFKESGKGYQTRINNVLRAFVQTRQRRQSAKPTGRTARRAKQAVQQR
jgi:uncharacterized protein (DUF4415 family)